jgi:hypothetical protein
MLLVNALAGPAAQVSFGSSEEFVGRGDAEEIEEYSHKISNEHADGMIKLAIEHANELVEQAPRPPSWPR